LKSKKAKAKIEFEIPGLEIEEPNHESPTKVTTKGDNVMAKTKASPTVSKKPLR